MKMGMGLINLLPSLLLFFLMEWERGAAGRIPAAGLEIIYLYFVIYINILRIPINLLNKLLS